MALVHVDSPNGSEPEVHGDPVNGGMVFWRNPDLPCEKYRWPASDAAELIAFAPATVERHCGIE